jgi:hypothetical protein
VPAGIALYRPTYTPDGREVLFQDEVGGRRAARV